MIGSYPTNSSVRSRWRSLVALVAIFGIVSSASFASSSETVNSDADPGPASSAPAVEVEEIEKIDWGFVGLSVLDAVILRPLGAATTVGGFAIFLVAAPFVAPSGRIGTAWDVFVYGAYDETFVRPLGEI